jgi:hypothetical protein
MCKLAAMTLARQISILDPLECLTSVGVSELADPTVARAALLLGNQVEATAASVITFSGRRGA